MKYIKQILLLALLVLASFTVEAQKAPAGIQYQAVLRDNTGQVVAGKSIQMRISINDPETRTLYYTESHSITTSPVGVFTVVVGAGKAEKGAFSDIPWATANTWVEIAYDLDNNGLYEIVGNTRMLSVPYAFFAEKAGSTMTKSGVEGPEGDATEYWALKGNLEVDENQHYLGTASYSDLVIKTHGKERIRITKGNGNDIPHDGLIHLQEEVLADKTLSVLGDFMVGGNTILEKDLLVVGEASFLSEAKFMGTVEISKQLDVHENVVIDGGLNVQEAAEFENIVKIDLDLYVYRDVFISRNTDIGNDLHVGGDADIDQNLNVDVNAHIGNDLDVDGNGNVDMNLHVGKDADIDHDLNVDNNTHIGNDLDVDGNANVDMNLYVGKNVEINNDLDVNHNTNIDVDLHVGNDVDIDHNLNVDNDLTVQNNANILGDLDVAGQGSFYDLEVEHNLHVINDVDIDQDLNVDGNVDIALTLQVEGETTLNDDLQVNADAVFAENVTINQSLTIDKNLTVSNDVTIGGDLIVDNPITANCKLTVNSCINGTDDDIDNYPVLVQGGDQGIAVKISGSRTTDNNYISFWDDYGMHGRIEGRSYNELLSSFEFIWSNSMKAAEEAFSIAMVVACLASVVPDVAESVVWGVEGLLTLAEWVEYNVTITNNVGVAYESGSGDYAEWLERANPLDDMVYGEIVGVRGGKISRNTDAADHYMVISKAPIVLGNMPESSREKDFEKVAFMGQVPVRVMGKVAVGDYILPSGFNDGYARAVSPAKMQIADYVKIVGVAWQAGEAVPMNIVNVAVGVNTNDLAAQMGKQQQEINQMKQQLNQVFALLGQKMPYEEVETPALIPVANHPSTPERLTADRETLQQFSLLVEEHPEILQDAFSKAKAKLLAKGIDVNKYPEIAAIYDNPAQWIKTNQQKGYLDEMVLRAKKQVESYTKK